MERDSNGRVLIPKWMIAVVAGLGTVGTAGTLALVQRLEDKLDARIAEVRADVREVRAELLDLAKRVR